MTREEIEKAAKKIVRDWRNLDRPSLEGFLPTALSHIINAALEEAAKLCDDGDDPNRFVARIRALKIGAGK